MTASIGYFYNSKPSWGNPINSCNCSNIDMPYSSLADTNIYFYYEFNYMLWEQWDYLEIGSGNFIKMSTYNILFALIFYFSVKYFTY